MTTRLTDGGREILAEMERDADDWQDEFRWELGPAGTATEPACFTCGDEPGNCPDCRPIADPERLPATLPPPLDDEPDDDDDPEPDDDDEPSDLWQLPEGSGDAREWGAAVEIAAADRAWETGYTAGRDSAEAELRDAALTISRLEAALVEARADLMAAGR